MLELQDEFDDIVSISRTEKNIEVGNLKQIVCDINEISPSVICQVPDSISLVVYVVSEWGETSNMLIEEYDRFTNTGPRGFLNTFNLLKNSGKLNKGALVLSIGSIASQLALGRYSKSDYPINSVSKLLQKTLISQLATCNSDFRFSLLTLGSFEHLGYPAIIDSIRHLRSLSKVAQFSELELFAKDDIRKR